MGHHNSESQEDAVPVQQALQLLLFSSWSENNSIVIKQAI